VFFTSSDDVGIHAGPIETGLAFATILIQDALWLWLLAPAIQTHLALATIGRIATLGLLGHCAAPRIVDGLW
jgi:hypothetical protein